MSNMDAKGAEHLLRIDASNAELGAAISDALCKSRWVLGERRVGSTYSPEVVFDPDLYDRDRLAESYASWTQRLLDRYGLKTRRALFKDMLNCWIESVDGVVRFMPSHHEKLEKWRQSPELAACNVVVPADSGVEVLGSALRQAIAHCS